MTGRPVPAVAWLATGQRRCHAEVVDVSAWHQPPSPRGRPGVTSYTATVRFQPVDGTVVETSMEGAEDIAVRGGAARHDAVAGPARAERICAP